MKLFRRRKYIINQDFQFRYTGYLVGLASILFLVFVIATKYYINLNLDPLIETGLITSPAAAKLLTLEKAFLSKNLLTIFLVLISILTVAGIFITHKISGPLFALKRRMQEITRGGVGDKKLKIRRGDEFQELIDTFNDMVVSLDRRKKGKKKDENEREAA